jgi:ABC-type protease/lipase transport system fused ATPase/permease subunit
MMIWFLSILFISVLAEIEIGVIAFVATLIIVVIAVIVKILKNKKLQKNNHNR